MEKPGNRDFDQNIFGSKNVFVGNVMKRQEKLSFFNLENCTLKTWKSLEIEEKKPGFGTSPTFGHHELPPKYKNEG